MRDPEQGTELLLALRQLHPDTPIMLLTDLEQEQHGPERKRLGEDLVILQNPRTRPTCGRRSYSGACHRVETTQTATRSLFTQDSARSSCGVPSE